MGWVSWGVDFVYAIKNYRMMKIKVFMIEWWWVKVYLNSLIMIIINIGLEVLLDDKEIKVLVVPNAKETQTAEVEN